MISITGFPWNRFDTGVPWNISPADRRIVPSGFAALSRSIILARYSAPPTGRSGSALLSWYGMICPWVSFTCRMVRLISTCRARDADENRSISGSDRTKIRKRRPVVEKVSTLLEFGGNRIGFLSGRVLGISIHL